MKKIIILGSLFGLLLAPSMGMAQTFIPEDEDLGSFEEVNLGEAQPYEVAARIINVALGFMGIFTLALIIWGGFIWMNARGNQEEVSKAKKILEGAIIGLVIVLASFGISQYIFENLVSVTQ